MWRCEKHMKKIFKKLKKYPPWKLFRELYLFFNIIFMLYPLFFMFMSAFKTNREIEVTPFQFPTGLDAIKTNINNVISGQIGGLRLTPFINLIGNTFFLTIGSLIIMLACATLCAYSLGRLSFKGKTYIIIFILIVQTVPFFGYIIPLFFAMYTIRLYDTLFGVIPVYVAVSLPATIILMIGFFKAFPKAVEEAALIDGCSEATKFIYIVIPMSLSIIGSMAIINFMGFWNEFAIASLLLKSTRLFTINMGVFALKTQLGGVGKKDYIMTLLTLSALPNLLFFTLLQKSIIKGVSLGSVKG